MDSYVIKRNGEQAPVRFDAITDRNKVLCSAAYGHSLDHVGKVLPVITQEVVSRFKNGMTTHELDMLTASVCAAKSTRHQDYSDLAARIIISNLQKSTVPSFIETMRKNSRIHPEFLKIAERASNEIDKRIDFSRDFKFTCFGIQTMIRSYLFRESDQDSKTIERPQHAYMRVALAICVGQQDKKGYEVTEDIFHERLEQAFEVYDLLSTHKLTHASPTMFNAGTNHSQLSSCYLLSVDDNLEALLQADKDAGMISKWAGGIGICITPMRSEGSIIKTTGGKSSGIRRYIAKLNSSQLYVNQGGLRPGAYALYLETWHEDIITFIEMGRFKGVSINAIDLKYALWVNDMFMEAVMGELKLNTIISNGEQPDEKTIKAANWYLFSPDTAPGLEKCYGEEFRTLYNKYVKEERYTRVIKPSLILTEWFKTITQKGNPYILFKDQINKKSNLSHYRTITNSNLCVTADTRILTEMGQFPIGNLVDRNIKIWNGEEWSMVTIRKTSPKSNIIRVSLDNWSYIDCTYEHKFYNHMGKVVRAGDLTPGTYLERVKSWPIIKEGGAFKNAYMNGLFAAQGYFYYGNHFAVDLYGNKRVIIDDPRFDVNHVCPGLFENKELDKLTVFLPQDLVPKYSIPMGANINDKIHWIEGYCDGNGTITYNGNDVCLHLWSTEVSFLNEMRLMLQTMGCDPKLMGGTNSTPITINGINHISKEEWYIQINNNDLYTLNNLGFKPITIDLSGVRKTRKSNISHVKVLSIEPIVKQAPTFCFTETKRGKGVFGGVLTGNCAEITIPCFNEEDEYEKAEYGTCNLGSIPLASFVVPDMRANNPGKVRIDWKSLIHAAGVAIRNLDNVIDINFYPVEACRRSNMKHRPVALGIMGLADVLAKFKYAYGSQEAYNLDRTIHAVIYYGAMKMSSKLGKERGNFATFEGSATQRGLLQPDLWVKCGDLKGNWPELIEEVTNGYLNADMWDELRKECMIHLRNAYVTADMPTATSSQATGQNECFEPFTSNLYTRKTLAGEFTILNTHLLAELEDIGLWDDEMYRSLIASAGSIQNINRIPADIKHRYRTARELDQNLLTQHAKARNPFLSQTQSLNYYFGEPLLRDALTIIVNGWKEGLTTGSYYIHTQPAVGTAKTSIAPTSKKEIKCTEECDSCSV